MLNSKSYKKIFKVLRVLKNEIIDDQAERRPIRYITLELTKFTKQLADIQTDLDKLVFTMKTLHTVTEASKFPEFWDEEWLQKAIQEVDLRAMTAEQKLVYEMAISANVLALKNENKKIEEIRLADKKEAIKKALKYGKLSIEEIADYNDVSIDFVIAVQKEISKV